VKRRFLAPCALVLLLVGCRREAQTPSSEITVNKDNFQEQVLRSTKPVMVDVFATWCGPCRAMAPVVEELAAEFQGRAVVGKLDGDENSALVKQYAVGGYPTFLFFKNGKVVDRVEGSASKGNLAMRLRALVEK